jgi:toxin-antitoxin system PIN domain toxin
LRYLLDVNVWVALLDEAHVHHAQALAFVQRRQVKIATCPLVENGVIRILNLPGYSRYGPAGFEAVQQKLLQICADLDHEFWSDSVSLLTESRVNWSRVLGHNQITDVYLLALAVANKACLVTLDHRVALSTVHEAGSSNLMLL